MNESVTGLTSLALLSPFVAALLAPFLVARLKGLAVPLLALVPGLAFAHFLRFLPEVARGEIATGGHAWVPSYNLSFSYLIDGLSLTFALLITGIGTLIVLYAGAYLRGDPRLGRFLGFLLLFMGAMLGLVLSDSFLMLFVFWEMTSISSFLLIGFDHGRAAARRAALQALVITGGGGLALLAGLLLIWNITGVTQFSLLALFGEDLRASPYCLAALLLMLGGAFTKSAQFPFHAWLPNAMEAPTPVSAYLHSATMVKAGIYLMMRLSPELGAHPAWQIILPVAGGVTLIVGTVLALRQTDLKLILAYTTVASLGLLTLLIGLGSAMAVKAAVLYLVAHSLFKGALFMLAGSVDHGAHSRDLRALSGLAKVMPVTFAAALLAALSMGGLPPFLGFIAKEEIYAALPSGPRGVILVLVLVAGNAMMAAAGFAVGLKPFLGKPSVKAVTAHEGGAGLWLPPMLLSIGGLLAALFSADFHGIVSSPMASAVAGQRLTVTASAMPHAGLPLVYSLITLALALGLYLALDRLRPGLARLLEALGPGPDAGFDSLIRSYVRLATRFTRMVQTGRLERYVTASIAALALILLVPMALYGEWPSLPLWPAGVQLHELVFMVIAVAGLWAVLSAQNRLTAIVALGIQGFAVAVLFLLFGAPDLSFTQFMIETLSVVVLALVMTRLRLSPSDHRPAGERLIDGALALACGTGLTLLLMAATEGPFNRSLTEFYNMTSKTIAHGANVVNVIIVDFRGTDTLGEIAVVMVTGLAILALLRLSAGRPVKLADNDPDADHAREGDRR